MKNTKKLSLVIVTYNSSQLIGRVLESILLYNDIGDALEIIIVDNCSQDRIEIQRIAELLVQEIVFVECTENRGYGAGNNKGVEMASAPIILIMNPDVVLHRPIFNEIIDNFEINKKLGILGLQQLETENGPKNHSFISNKPTVSQLFLHKFASKLNLFTPIFFAFSGACFAIRKKSFIEAGKFDEEIFLYWEEADLQYRLIKKANANKVIFRKDLSYVHAMHKRKLSLDQHVLGVSSYLHMMKQRGNKEETSMKTILRFYGFLQVYNNIRGYKTESDFYVQLSRKLIKLQGINGL